MPRGKGRFWKFLILLKNGVLIDFTVSNGTIYADYLRKRRRMYLMIYNS